MTLIDDRSAPRRRTWRVAAASPPGTWRVPIDPDDPELAWQLSLTVHARLGRAAHLVADAIETTAVEEPRTWSMPANAVQDGWRSQAPAARRIPARRAPEPPPGDAVLVPAEPPADAPTPRPLPPPPSEEADPTPVVEPMPFPRPQGEHGDRDMFLALARQRLAGGIPVNLVHPPPPRPVDPAAHRPDVPAPVYANVDPDDLLATFARSVEEAGGVCHQVVGQVPDALLDQLVAELEAWDVVVSQDPEAVALGARLADRGVDVSSAEREPTAQAALGVTSAVAAIAATGSVVLDSARSGGRLSSVLPPAHVCVLPVERLVATPADVLRRLGDDPAALPSSLVLVTGPSRTGDIEQLLTIGAHGPTALHVIVVSPPEPPPDDGDR